MRQNCFYIWLSFSLSHTVVAQQPNRFQDSHAIDTYFQYKPDKKQPILLAHRGGPRLDETENTIATFSQTTNVLPNSIVEMDVRTTYDNEFVLLHDATLDRESNGTGSVEKWTLADLKNLKLKTVAGELTTQTIPTLTDVLVWNANRFILALDVKPGTDPLRVIQEVQEHQAIHSVFIICYSLADAQRIRQQHPLLWLAIGVSNIDDIDHFETTQLVKSGRWIALTPQKIQPTRFYERLHKLGVLSAVGTYGKGQLDEKPITDASSEYQFIIKQGGDIITTDRPIEVSALFP